MVWGKGGDGGEAADRGEGADAELHHERYGTDKMRGEGGAMLAERVGRVVVGLVTCHGSRDWGEASFPSIPNRLWTLRAADLGSSKRRHCTVPSRVYPEFAETSSNGGYFVLVRPKFLQNRERERERERENTSSEYFFRILLAE